jgi:hypothetical protein
MTRLPLRVGEVRVAAFADGGPNNVPGTYREESGGTRNNVGV